MQNQTSRPHFEFVALMAALMSTVALAIDAILPAISHIGISIHSLDPTQNQLLITMIFLGLGFGQLVFGPLSDSFGRKPVVYAGFALFALASIICVLAPNMEWMIVGRILQGVGLSAPRTITLSIIRDTYRGDYMARVMSFVSAFFILVPVVAPALGKLILDHFGWQGIFYMQLLFGLLVVAWFRYRQPETLSAGNRIAFSRHIFWDGLKEVLRYRETVAFTIISGLITGAFLVYLSASQHVFEDQYGLVESFPYIFAGLALSIGVSTFLNGTLVLRFGRRKLSFTALMVFSAISLLYVVLFWGRPNPSALVLVVFLFFQFGCLGFLWGNFNSIAMEPIGHIAGMGAAIVGFVSTLMSIPIATYVGGFVTDTVWPLFAGLSVCGLLSLGIFMAFGRYDTVIQREIG